MSENGYPIVIERQATGYSVYSPDVPGCAAAGDTEDEVMREICNPILELSSSVDYIEVGA